MEHNGKFANPNLFSTEAIEDEGSTTCGWLSSIPYQELKKKKQFNEQHII